MTDLELLRQYATARSEESFAQLVTRHIDWIHTTARRYVRDPALAEDVTQAVFITLSRKAPVLAHSPKISITGWLFTTTRYASASALKIEKRRRIHELQAAAMKKESLPNDPEFAWPAVESQLNAGLARLSATDREALLLRYFQNLTHESLAAALNISPAAAQKRVSRALDRLRNRIAPTLSAAVFADLITHRAVTSAPPHLSSANFLSTAANIRSQLIAKGISTMKTTFFIKAAIIPLSVAALVVGSLTAVILSHAAAAPVPTPAASDHLPPFDITGVRYVASADQNVDPSWTITIDLQKRLSLETIASKGWTVHCYFSGNDEFIYRDGGTLFFKQRPLNSVDEQIATGQNNFQLLRDSTALRDPASDETIDGKLCPAYVITTPATGDHPNTTEYVTIDPTTHRPLHVITPTLNITLTYDPTLPENFFKLPDGSAQATTTLDYLEKKYPLDKALTTKTALGQIFAVHQAVQDSVGCYEIICSQRLTPEARAKITTISPAISLGDFKLNDHVFPYRYFRLGHLRSDGIVVSYFLVIPQKPAAPDNTCQFALTMTSSEPVLKAIAADPADSRDIYQEIILTIPLAPNPPTPQDFMARTYDEVAPLVGMLTETSLYSPARNPGLSTKSESLAAFDRALAKYQH